jgi:hypothetical protein
MGHLEANDEYRLVTNGFVIYEAQEKSWVLKKVATKNNQNVFSDIVFETYVLAKEFALKSIGCKDMWIATARYDRGLGIEYINIENISAKTNSEANDIAYDILMKKLHDKNIIKEIKVKNKM